jgi:hypothetical protein
MANTSKVAPIRAASKAIPLSAIRITWTRPAHFLGEKDPVPVTLTGEKLATILGWLSSHDKNLTLDWFGDVALQQEGLGEILRALSDADAGEMEPCPIFWTLGRFASDLAARAMAAEDGKDLLAKATVQIERGAEAEVAR